MRIVDLDEMKDRIPLWESSERAKLAREYETKGAPEVQELNRDVMRIVEMKEEISKRLFAARRDLLLIRSLMSSRSDFQEDRTHGIGSTRKDFDTLKSCGSLPLQFPVVLTPDAPVVCPVCGCEIRLRLYPLLESRPAVVQALQEEVKR